MMKAIKKYSLVPPILVLFYLNFYFLSPFIHEHPIEIEGQAEMKNVPHSHLASIVIPNLNDGYVSRDANSHSHNFAFDIPIIIQPTEQFDNIISSYTLCQMDENSEELEIKFEIMIGTTHPHAQVLWERYVQFATNNSPPLLHSTQLS